MATPQRSVEWECWSAPSPWHVTWPIYGLAATIQYYPVVATSQAEPNQAQAKPNQAKPGQRFRLINQTGRALRPGLDSLPSISNTLWLS